MSDEDYDDFDIGADEWDCCRMVSRAEDREELAQLVAEFLARGGTIQMIAPGVTGLADGFMTKAMVATANRHNTMVSDRARAREAHLVDIIKRNLCNPDPMSIDTIALHTGASVARVRKLHQIFFADDERAQRLLSTGKRTLQRNHSKALHEQRAQL